MNVLYNDFYYASNTICTNRVEFIYVNYYLKHDLRVKTFWEIQIK